VTNLRVNNFYNQNNKLVNPRYPSINHSISRVRNSMLLKKSAAIGIILLCFYFEANSQDKLVHGVIKDAQTFKPISFVTIVSSSHGSFSNNEGYFTIKVHDGDSIKISHINYDLEIILTIDLEIPLLIFLNQKVHLLNEIVVSGFPSENELREEVLKTRIQPTQFELNAKNNIYDSHLIFLSGYEPDFDFLDNYKMYLKGPQDATFISTNPSKGLLKAFKNISRNKTLFKRRKYPPSYIEPSIFNQLVEQPKSDSIKMIIKK